MEEIRKSYVYEWFIVDTNEIFYVGKGKGKRAQDVKNRSRPFMQIYNEHECSYRFIEKDLTNEEACLKEIEYIKLYRERGYPLVNMTSGGDDMYTLSSLFKDPIWRSEIIRARRDPSSTYQSVEFKQKISKLVTGKNNPNYGHKWSQAMKDALRDKKMGHNQYGDNPHSKAVMCVETQEQFECLKAAAEKYNMKSPSSISTALNKPNRIAYGYHWITIDKTSDNSRLTQ